MLVLEIIESLINLYDDTSRLLRVVYDVYGAVLCGAHLSHVL